eukprot:GHRQ01033937.1.p1 GENE.GHRQ01033937.1~~GHRQ01033937.1.p1  ORF type:complete len:185 (+),score=56.49 GHRQ01033937.1:451-1005(+)
MGQATAGVESTRGRWLGLKASWIKPLAFGALNIASASGIVFANKLVMTTYGFSFTCTLTWIHTLFTLVGMRLFLMAGMFQHKSLQLRQVLPLAAAYVGYIVLCNLSLQVNTVGFYQVMKIAVAPTVMLLDLIVFGIVPAPKVSPNTMGELAQTPNKQQPLCLLGRSLHGVGQQHIQRHQQRQQQ